MGLVWHMFSGGVCLHLHTIMPNLEPVKWLADVLVPRSTPELIDWSYASSMRSHSHSCEHSTV